MDDAPSRALRDCVVAVRSRVRGDLLHGSGFFVSPTLLLTCHHLVDGATSVEIRLGHTWHPAAAQPLAPPLAADVALLEAPMKAPAFARLGRRAAIGDPVRVLGFPVREDAQHEDAITGQIEALEVQHVREPWKSGARLIKFKQAQILPGFSGSPLYDERERRIVGIVNATRDRASDLGGLAVPARLVLDAHPVLRKAQHDFDWQGTFWRDPHSASRAFLAHHLDPHEPFFGRDATLHDLDQWMVAGPPQALVVADAGRGKTSLLARWFARLRESEAVEMGRLHVALVPISPACAQVREPEVLEVLGRCIAEWHPDLRVAAGERRWRDLIADGLQAAAPPGEQFLLLVDGLDETQGWQIDANLFPRTLGQGTRVLATARRMVHRDFHGWCQQLGWRPHSTAAIALPALAESDLVDAAANWWQMPREQAKKLGVRLHALSGGDPLVFGAYLTSLDRRAPPSPESLASLPPGLAGVFKQWWERQLEAWRIDAAPALETIGRHVFNLLAAACEPISRPVLLAVLQRLADCEGDDLDRALAGFARFIVGNREAYLLSHPEMARWRWHEMETDRVSQRYDRAYLQWARSCADQDPATAIDVYALLAYARHVERASGKGAVGLAHRADWQRIVGGTWRAHHERSSLWPTSYAANLALAAAAARGADMRDLAARRACSGLPVLIGAAVGRVSISRLKRRVGARLAVEAVQRGRWPAARALNQALATFQGDFPRIEALGTIAACLGIAELERAMATLAVERDIGFDWDDSLGAWKLAAAVAASGGFDDSTIARWVESLQGFGTTVALFGLAAAHDGAARSRWLVRAMAQLRKGPDHATARTLVACGVCIGRHFTLAELQAATQPGFCAWDTGERLGFTWDPALHSTATAGAALRVAWPWLDAGERLRCAQSLVDEVPHWIGVLEAGGHVHATLAPDQTWQIAHGNWGSRLGALWDVCPPALALQVYRALRAHFDDSTATGSTERTAFTVLLRFASRLPPNERAFERLPGKVSWLAFAGSSHAPETRDLYAAAAALPEWQHALCEAVLQKRPDRESEALLALEGLANVLPSEALERLWMCVGEFRTDARDGARQTMLGALATRGESDALLALARADEPERGAEHRLLGAVLLALRGQPAAARQDALLAMTSFPHQAGYRAQLASALAAPLGPWTLDDVEAWMAQGLDSRTLGWLLPHVEPRALADAQTPWRLAARRIRPDSDAAAEQAILQVHTVSGLGATLLWAGAMDQAVGESSGANDRDWTALAICALAPLAAGQLAELLRVALALEPLQARAEACAALAAVPCDAATEAWPVVEAALRGAGARGEAGLVARLLRRLSGRLLYQGIEASGIQRDLLPRRGSAMMWIDRASVLMDWADPALIDSDFMPQGQLAELKSSTDRDLLRAALAPRLMALGRTDEAIAMAASAAGSHVWWYHTAMLALITRPEVARRLVHAMLRHAHGDLSLFAVARELQRGACRAHPAVEHAFCDALLDAADSDARLQLHLAVLAPLIHRLGGDDALAALNSVLKR